MIGLLPLITVLLFIIVLLAVAPAFSAFKLRLAAITTDVARNICHPPLIISGGCW